MILYETQNLLKSNRWKNKKDSGVRLVTFVFQIRKTLLRVFLHWYGPGTPCATSRAD